MPNAAPPCVIVNADDLGMSVAVNDAVFRAYDAGLLCSTTVLVHGPAFGDAARRLLARPGLRVGVHLDASEFAPRRDPADWPDQVARARDAGIDPTHLDAHHHAHLAWRALPALRAVCAASGLARVRGRSLDHGRAWRSRAWRAVVGRFARMPDRFLTLTHLDAGPRLGPIGAGVTEIMVHPGNPHHARYAHEMARLAALAPGWRIAGFDVLGAPPAGPVSG